jgi:outer membrane protein TolC
VSNTATLRIAVIVAAALLVAGCYTPGQWRKRADRAAYELIKRKQREALGRTEPFTIERSADTLRRRLLKGQDLPIAAPASLGTKAIKPIKQWPKDDYLSAKSKAPPSPWQGSKTLKLSLSDALQIGARSSRDYQREKENVFETALGLDLERDDFRHTWTGSLDSEISTDHSSSPTVTGVENNAALAVSRTLKAGATLAASLGVDLVKLLTQDQSSSWGLFGDATVSIPLMRGAGRFVVTEPLTQAERDVVYAIYEFERFKRTFAVRVASDYLNVLQQLDQVANAEGNYRRLVSSTRLVSRLADAGDRPEKDVDETKQDELRARQRWISALQNYERRLDNFKILLGLPTDANIELDPGELKRLASNTTQDEQEQDTTGRQTEQVPDADAPIELVMPSRKGGGPLEMKSRTAIELALAKRLDLRVAVGRVLDSQRSVVVAADMLRADLTLFGSAAAGSSRSLGSAGSANADLRPENGMYSGMLSLDLALERTSERNAYRGSLIDLEQQVRSVQDMEDQVKLDVRNGLRSLLESREGVLIQAEAMVLATRRVANTPLLFQAGRASIRDVLFAQEDLVSAQNAFTSALVRYRVAELELQRDLGVLQVNELGLFEEYRPKGDDDE